MRKRIKVKVGDVALLNYSASIKSLFEGENFTGFVGWHFMYEEEGIKVYSEDMGYLSLHSYDSTFPYTAQELVDIINALDY